MALDLKKQWTDTKKLYEQTVGKKKPSTDFLSFIARRSTGVGSSLGAFDDALAAYENDHKPASFAKMEKAGAAAAKAIKDYEKVLGERTKADKLADPAYTKGLDVLRKDLDAITGQIEEKIETVRGLEKLATEGQHKPDSEKFAMMNSHLAKQWKVNAGATLKNLAAAVAKARAKPEPATYSAVLMKPLRDISMLFTATNLKQLGLAKLADSSAYPGKAIDFLANMQTSSTQPQTAEAVTKAVDAISTRTHVVTTWFVNVAKPLS